MSTEINSVLEIVYPKVTSGSPTVLVPLEVSFTIKPVWMEAIDFGLVLTRLSGCGCLGSRVGNIFLEEAGRGYTSPFRDWGATWRPSWICSYGSKTRWQLWPGGFCLGSSCASVEPFSCPGGLQILRLYSSCDWTIAIDSTWDCPWRPSGNCSCICVKCRNATTSCYAHMSVLVPVGFQVQFKVLVITYKALHATTLWFTCRIASSPIICLVCSDKVGAVQVPSIK